MSNAWIILFVAAMLEVTWAIMLPRTRGFTVPVPSIVTLAAMIASMYLLSVAARDLPIGTAYAVWTGFGAAGTAILGIYIYSESSSIPRLACIGMIILGIAGVKYFDQSKAAAPPPRVSLETSRVE